MSEKRVDRQTFLRRGAAVAAGVALAGSGLESRAVRVQARDAGAAVPSGKISVAIWGAQPDYATLVPMVNAYRKQYPQVTVDLREVGFGCGVDYAACKTLIAGGTMPDVFVPGIWNYNAMVDDNVLLDVEPLIKRDKLNLADFNPGVIKSIRALRDGHLYGLPMGFNAQSLFYNKDMFDKAKLPYPPANGNYTYQDLRRWAKRLTLDANGNTPYDTNFNPKRIKQWGFETRAVDLIAPGYDFVLLAFGGSTMTLDRQRCNLEHPDSIRAWQFIQDLMWKDHSTVTPQQNQEEPGWERWIAGHVAMENGAHDQVQFVRQQNPNLRYDMAALPREKAGNATSLQMHIWAIFSRTKNPDLAWHFVKFAAGPGSGKEMALIPAYKNYALGPDFLKAPGEPAHLKQAQLDPLKWRLALVPTCFNQKSDEIAGQDGFGPALQAIITNKKTAAEALAGVSKRVDAIMKG